MYEDEPTQNYENISGTRRNDCAGQSAVRQTFSSLFEDPLYLTPRLSIIAGAQAIFAERHFQDEFLTDAAGNQSNRQNFGDSIPKLGAIYEINRNDTGIHEFQSQLATAFVGHLVDFTEGPNSSCCLHAIAAATRWTVEVGTVESNSRFQWELSLYRSWRRNELSRLMTLSWNDIGTRNYRATTIKNRSKSGS
jgi:hypothetical protein